jgi:DNA-binding FadR family transcriptional regulator
MSARSEQVLVELRRWLDDRGLAAGDRLPAERTLARELGCSRETLRAALAVMERANEVWRHVGQGTFYGPRPLGHPIRENILIQGASPLQLMQARRIIEPSVAGEAAGLASAPEVAYLSDLVAQGRRATTRAACERVDAAFHRAIAEATANPILLGLLDYLAGARRHAAWQREWELTYRRLGVTEFTGRHSDQHQAIVDAIARNDPGGAAEAMRDHLDTIFEAMRDAGLTA